MYQSGFQLFKEILHADLWLENDSALTCYRQLYM